jgi:hypothetical protein
MALKFSGHKWRSSATGHIHKYTHTHTHTHAIHTYIRESIWTGVEQMDGRMGSGIVNECNSRASVLDFLILIFIIIILLFLAIEVNVLH